MHRDHCVAEFGEDIQDTGYGLKDTCQCCQFGDIKLHVEFD